MTLHPAIGSNRYCGPGALAILTGHDTRATAAKLRELTGKRAILDTPHQAMVDALTSWGFEVAELFDFRETQPKLHRPTLARLAPTLGAGLFLIVITDHYVVLDTAALEVCDNLTIYPLPLARYRKRRARVARVWAVSPSAPRLH